MVRNLSLMGDLLDVLVNDIEILTSGSLMGGFDKLSQLEHFIFGSGCLYLPVSISQLFFNLFSQKHFE